MTKIKTVLTTNTVSTFLDACPDPVRRADAHTLARLIENISGFQPAMWGTAIVGFGSMHYVYESGREGDMPIVSFAPRKSANVLYGTRGFDGADALLARLGKHTTGKGCLNLKNLADVDMVVLETLIRSAVTAKRARIAQGQEPLDQ